MGVWSSSSFPVIGEGTVWASIQDRGLEGTNVFPRQRGSGPVGPWLVQDKVGHGCQALGWGRIWPCFSLQTAPPQQVDCARHINGSFLSIPPGWEGGMRGSPCPPPETDGTPGAGEGAEKLPPHSLIRPRTHVFILKHPWVLRPSQDSSDHQDSAAAYTNRVSLRR